MPRLPVVSASSDPETMALISRIRAERGGDFLLLYKVLLNSPTVAAGWLSLLTAVRQQTAIPGTLREMIILRVAQLNRAPYEFASHMPHAVSEGVAESDIEALGRGDVPGSATPAGVAVFRYVDAMTRDIEVAPSTYHALTSHFDARQLLELTVLIAAYNMVSRVLVALQIDAEQL